MTVKMACAIVNIVNEGGANIGGINVPCRACSAVYTLRNVSTALSRGFTKFHGAVSLKVLVGLFFLNFDFFFLRVTTMAILEPSAFRKHATSRSHIPRTRHVFGLPIDILDTD